MLTDLNAPQTDLGYLEGSNIQFVNSGTVGSIFVAYGGSNNMAFFPVDASSGALSYTASSTVLKSTSISATGTTVWSDLKTQTMWGLQDDSGNLLFSVDSSKVVYGCYDDAPCKATYVVKMIANAAKTLIPAVNCVSGTQALRDSYCVEIGSDAIGLVFTTVPGPLLLYGSITILAGYGRVGIISNLMAWTIDLTGFTTNRGKTVPAGSVTQYGQLSESAYARISKSNTWVSHGILESMGTQTNIVYGSVDGTIERLPLCVLSAPSVLATGICNSVQSTVFSAFYLSNLASFSVDVYKQRWYFRFNGGGDPSRTMPQSATQGYSPNSYFVGYADAYLSYEKQPTGQPTGQPSGQPSEYHIFTPTKYYAFERSAEVGTGRHQYKTKEKKITTRSAGIYDLPHYFECASKNKWGGGYSEGLMALSAFQLIVSGTEAASPTGSRRYTGISRP